MGGQGIQLSSRQQEILVRLVEEHVASGAPVGSKLLVERTEMEVSPSTVRYELATLEEQGYLTHPHTSAGRVPTDLGYRYYVDRLLERLQPRPGEPRLVLDLDLYRNQIDAGLRAITDGLAQLTHLLALVSAPPLTTATVRHVEVLLLQPSLVMVVVITSTGGVTKQLCEFERPIDPGLVDWAREYLNERVAGLELGAHLLRSRFGAPELAPLERRFLARLLPAFAGLEEVTERTLYVGGAAELLQEFVASELGAYRRLLQVLEQRATVLELTRGAQSLVSKRPYVRVGAELEDPELRSFALVGAPYGLRHRNLGTVSLVGPTRMDYVKAIEAVRWAALELSRLVEDVYGQ